MVSIGFVAGLDYRDVEFSVHDVLQEFKTHPLVRKHPRGRRAGRLGREDDHRGRLPRAAEHASTRRGCCSCGEGAGLVNVPTLKGIHYAIESGQARGRGGVRARCSAGETPVAPGALAGYDEALRASYVWRTCYEVRNMRQAFDKGFFMGGALASAMTVTKGQLPAEGLRDASRTPRTRCSAPTARSATRRPTGS